MVNRKGLLSLNSSASVDYRVNNPKSLSIILPNFWVMSIIAIDANIPITFTQIHFWELFEDYVQKCGHSVIMPKEVYEEVIDREARQKLQKSSFVQKIEVSENSFQALKNICTKINRFEIQDNDYKLITLACDKGADYLVSNDSKLILAAKRYNDNQPYCENKPIPIVPPELFWLMYSERKDIFGLKKDISINLRYYRKIELERMYDGIKNKKWECSFCQDIFDTYQENILRAIATLNEQKL